LTLVTFRAWVGVAFVSGFAGTAYDAVTIQSVSGHVVWSGLAARQTDGSVKTYEARTGHAMA